MPAVPFLKKHGNTSIHFAKLIFLWTHSFNMVQILNIAAALALVSSVTAQCGSGTPDATVTVRKAFMIYAGPFTDYILRAPAALS